MNALRIFAGLYTISSNSHIVKIAKPGMFSVRPWALASS
jgi:hypothetical protein